MNIDKAIQSAIKHHRAGNLQQAEDLYKKILKKQPENVDVLHMLGVVYSDLGNYELAIKHIKKALHYNPTNYHAYYNLGNAFRDNRQPEEAIESYQKTIQLNPYFVDAYYNLGILLQDSGFLEEAILQYRKALKLNPNFYNSYYNLGNVLRGKGLLDEAMVCYQKVIQLNPEFAGAHCNLGNVLHEKGKLDEAITHYQKALQLNQNLAEVYNNLGNVLHDSGHFEKALTCYQKAIQLNPDLADAHWNIALIHLLTGNFREGWKGYEWRWKLKDPIQRVFAQPLWDGSDIEGRTILLYAEQGFGDAIQFIRYAPLIAQRGAQVIVECHKELASLIRNVEGVQEIFVFGEQLPKFDVHCPLLSLPLVFDTTLETIPAKVPYISADSTTVRKWEDRLKHDNAELKIGLLWAGNPKLKGNIFRSFSLETFSPLAQLDNITFYSLQKGEASEQAKNPPEGMRLIDYTDEIHDFSDTAALIENLDLVISADTAVAHLAGAMGKPVWTMIPFAPDWRWLLNREDSPWYPTMRLFRQPSLGDWESLMNRILEELKTLIVSKDFQKSDYNSDYNIEREQFVNEKEAISINASESNGAGISGGYKLMEDKEDFTVQPETVALILNCEGRGDCLFAIPVIKKLYLMLGMNSHLVIFTHHPELFEKCPYIETAYSISNTVDYSKFNRHIVLFDVNKLPHYLVDTIDFISIPLGIGELSFREKQLEYFPVEEDRSQHFDVVINTSVTWPSRSWSVENWQKVADYILSEGYSVAVVGKDVYSKADNMWKRSYGLKGCVDFTNSLSLDQTYYMIRNCDLFITCQNGLSVMSGATDTAIIVLDMSIEWSKRAIYRNEDPHYKVAYVKGNCKVYCCQSFECPVYGEFRCIPTVEQVMDVIRRA